MPSRFAQRVVASTLSRTVGVACAFALLHRAAPVCTSSSHYPCLDRDHDYFRSLGKSLTKIRRAVELATRFDEFLQRENIRLQND